ncbi:tripartite tricarboxylate transporter TctB family protein [Allopusillimonas ginsengisoli]|uniref:tripartite tricarboxylate transporter TctB family protein n=1 Tax=Allopusillimonas ginsengisoli TaxID=453575 RepID=UPI00101F5D68|nr:tripartite tricarboxylate transporter TctB family protein [Allopusillimonas ginsengisoli]TEA70365.1 tripartite tricarboxylate transporter TctB family protein [Allopusillimonas ginsengisoli]
MMPKKQRPWWLGLAVIAIGLLWFFQGRSLPQLGGYAALGPGFFVTVIGGLIVLLGVILLVQIARGEQFTPQDTENAEANAAVSWPSLFYAAAAAAVPLLTMQRLGFPLTAMFSFALVTRAFGSRRIVFDCLIGLVLGVICWIGFSKLGVNLGQIMPLVEW